MLDLARQRGNRRVLKPRVIDLDRGLSVDIGHVFAVLLSVVGAKPLIRPWVGLGRSLPDWAVSSAAGCSKSIGYRGAHLSILASMSEFNHLGQPVGYPVVSWAGSRRPLSAPLEGCWCQVVPLDANLHSPTFGESSRISV